jgi:hypothetical protein
MFAASGVLLAIAGALGGLPALLPGWAGNTRPVAQPGRGRGEGRRSGAVLPRGQAAPRRMARVNSRLANGAIVAQLAGNDALARSVSAPDPGAASLPPGSGIHRPPLTPSTGKVIERDHNPAARQPIHPVG